MVDFPKPGAEHQKLRRLTGAWSARIKYYATPHGPPHESTGEFFSRMDLGGYFLCRDMNFGLQGFQGRGLTGYDVFRGTYVGTWVDSMSPIIYRGEGHFDERNVYCETSEGPGADGAPIRMRMTTEMLAPNEMLFSMFRLNEKGEESIVVEIAHTRRRFVE